MQEYTESYDNFLNINTLNRDVTDPNNLNVGVSGSVEERNQDAVAKAIDQTGGVVAGVTNSDLNTETREILGEFTFGPSGAITINTDSNNGLWLSPTGLLGKKAGVTTFSIANDGTAIFGGSVSGGTIYVPNQSTPKFSVDASGNMTAVSGKYIEKFTAGEAISDGDVVCIIPMTDVFYSSDSAWVDQYAPTTNNGTTDTLLVGDTRNGAGYLGIGYVNFDTSALPPSLSILSATLSLSTTTTFYNPADTLYIGGVSSTWSEGTVAYNTRPSDSNEIGATFFGTAAQGYTTTSQTKDFDVLQYIRAWSASSISRYGFSMYYGGYGSVTPGNKIAIASGRHATTSLRPRLTIKHISENDGYVYKASNSSYDRSRSVLGIAQNTASQGQEVSVQVHGTITNVGLGVSGGKIYLDDTGNIGTNTANYERIIPLGKVIGASSAILSIYDYDNLIESGVGNISGTSTKRWYFQGDTRYAIIAYQFTSNGATSTHRIVSYRGSDNPGSFTEHNEDSHGITGSCTVSWGTNYIDISVAGSGNSGTILGTYFYT